MRASSTGIERTDGTAWNDTVDIAHRPAAKGPLGLGDPPPQDPTVWPLEPGYHYRRIGVRSMSTTSVRAATSEVIDATHVPL